MQPLSNAQVEHLAETALAAGELARGTAEAITEIGHRLSAVEQQVAANPDAGKPHPVPRDQIAARVVTHPAIAQFAAQAAAGESPTPVRVTVPTLSNDISGAPGSAGALRVPESVPGIIGRGRRPLRVADLLTRHKAVANSVIFLRQTGDTSRAAPVPELAPKPQTEMTFEEVEAPVVALAHWARMSKQILADVPALQNFISSRLMYGLREAEEREILLGSGTGNNLHGLLLQATAAEMQNVVGLATGAFRSITVDTPNRMDVVKVAMLQIQLASGMQADAVVMHPSDVEAIRSMKLPDGTPFTVRPCADGKGGLSVHEDITHIWGLPVIVSTVMEVGQFLVGCFRDGAALYVRDELSVEIGYAESDFTQNAIRILCEERIALPVWMTSAFVTGQF